MPARISLRSTRHLEWLDLTERLDAAVGAMAPPPDAVLVYCPHTTAGITVNEGWDPAVAGDVTRALEALVPKLAYRHAEGNSPAHLLATLVGPSVVVPVRGGRVLLGRWQRVFFCEFDGPRDREVWVQALGGGGGA